MNHDMKGRRVFVSGSTSGIGAAIATRLAARGADVVIHGRDRGRAADLLDRLRSPDQTIMSVLADLTIGEDVRRLAAEVDARLGGIDVLVNNAGDAAPFSPDWFAVDATDWIAAYDRNVVGAVRLVQAFVPGMRERGWGRVINIGSSAYTKPTIDFPAYGPAKAALVNMTMGLARVLANTGVTSNIVSPGAVLTEAMQSSLQPIATSLGWPETDPEAIEHRLTRDKWPNTVGRMGRPDEIAGAVEYLAGDGSAYVSGANLRIDGGENSNLH